MTWQLLLAFSTFTYFAFMQARHIESFRGAVSTAMALLALAALVFQIAFLIWFGTRTHWYFPILLYAATLLITFTFHSILVTVLMSRSRADSPLVSDTIAATQKSEAIISLGGFIAIPLSGYLLLHYVQ